MKTKINTFLSSLKTTNPRDFAYPIIILLFFSIVVFFFLSSAEFISKNINKVFLSGTTSQGGSMDVPRYSLVAKKLNFPADMSMIKIEPPPETPLELDKKNLTLEIRVSTSKKNAAVALAKTLELEGFILAKTGAEKNRRRTTTVIIKESKYGYASILMQSVIKAYPDAQTATTSESALFDATIIIGER